MIQFFIKTLPLLLILSLIACGGGAASTPEEAEAWKEASQKNSLKALDSFLIAFPQTKLKPEIAKRREGMLFQVAKVENTEYHYKKYLKEFPQGKRNKEVEEKLKALGNDEIAVESMRNKTFVGSIRYLDGSKPDIEVLALKFSDIEDSGNEIRFKAAIHLTADVKKEMTGIIQKPQMSIKFEEGSDDTFLLDLPDGRAYMRDGQIVMESTDPEKKQYWKVK